MSHLPAEADSRRLVIGAAALLIAAATAFDIWALAGGWFYRDDYALLTAAHDQPFGLDYLLQPHDTRLLPGTRLLAWVVAAPGLSWPVAATLTIALQVAADAAAAWMLIRLFGARWAVLAPLGVYLTTAVTVPATTWWIASINQTPVQISFFVAVGAWVEYLRSRGDRWLALTVAAVAFGLLFFIKTLLVVGVLGYLALAYFATGSPIARFRWVAARYWPAAAAGAVLVGGYLVLAASRVSRGFGEASWAMAGDLAENMLGTAFPTGILGGPWGWSPFALPGSVADPPSWLVHLSWVLLTLLVLYGFLRRERTLRAWGLLALYLAGLLLLLMFSRGPQFGPIIGLEYRYLTDAACAFALTASLAFLPLRGSVEASGARVEPLLALRLSPALWIALVAAVCVSGVLSSAAYVRTWHQGNRSDLYVTTLRRELQAQGAVDLANRALPTGVIPALFAPDNTLRALVPLLSGEARFPDWTSRLTTVADDGTLRRAVIKPARVAERRGRPCGWLVEEGGRTIRLGSDLYPWSWWIRIAYLAAEESPVTVVAGGDAVDADILPGLNELFVRIRGSVDSVRLEGLRPGATMCVEAVEVGSAVPGGRL